MATWADIQQYFPQVQSSFDADGVQRFSINPSDRVQEIPGLGTVAFDVSDVGSGNIIPTLIGQGGLAPGPNGEIVTTKHASTYDDSFFGGALRDAAPGMLSVLGAGTALNFMYGVEGLGGSAADVGLGASEAGTFAPGGGAPSGYEADFFTSVDPITGAPTQLGAADPMITGMFPGAAGATGALSTLGTAAKTAGTGAATTSALQKILSGNGSMQDLLGLLGPAMGIASGIEGYGRADDMSNLINGDVNAAVGGVGGLNITKPALSLDPISGQMVDRSAQAKAAIAGADPWGASGGRALADEQLQALMKSPGSLMSDPGYQAKMMGVDRVMAAQGQLGGGGGAVAAANASGDYYDQRLKSLAALEAMGDPVNAQQIGLGQEQLGLSQGQLGLQGQMANSNQTLQAGQLDLDAQKAMADLGAAKGQLGLEGAKLKLAAAGGANTLAGQSLASIGYGVTQATGGNTFMSQAQQFLNSLRTAGATI